MVMEEVFVQKHFEGRRFASADMRAALGARAAPGNLQLRDSHKVQRPLHHFRQPAISRQSTHRSQEYHSLALEILR